LSIIQTLQTWLTGFNGMELWPIAQVLTDRPELTLSSYALAPSGNGNTSIDIQGNRTYQNSYVFYAREAATDEVDRRENYDFLEALTDWIEEQNDAGAFPALGVRYEVEEIQVSNAMLFDIDEDGTGTYQVQIQMIFMKRRE